VLLCDPVGSTCAKLTCASYVSIPLSTNPEWGTDDYATLSQSLEGATVGHNYFLTVQVNLLGLVGQGNCNINFLAGFQTLISYDYSMSAQSGTVYASGILSIVPSSLALGVSCSDYNPSPTDISISYDDVQLSVYDSSVGTNPIQPVASEGLKN
jgi:hypothetical protein